MSSRNWKFLHFSKNTFKKIYLVKYYKYLPIHECICFNRNMHITISFVYRTLLIYNGKGFIRKNIFIWSLGFPLGGLTWNRRLAIYKRKKKKKKNNV